MVKPRWRRGCLGWGMVPVACLVLVGVGWMLRGSMAPASLERLNAAEVIWRRADIQNYDMQVVITGAQNGRYDLVVRDGILRSIRHDGVNADPADGAYWTVEGLFRTLRRELQMAERSVLMVPGASRVVILAHFDREWGYPIAFLRQVTGSPSGVSVEVVSFQPR